MTIYSDVANPRATPQREKAREDQVKNNAGGFVFALDDWKRLDRFLILGSVGGSYYASERDLTRENLGPIRACLAADGPRVVARVAEISDAGRAHKNDPAIFVLALATVSKDPATRAAARAALGKVCRIGTHLFHFAEDVELAEANHKWGRGLRRAVARWYTDRSPDQVAFQAVKYAQRDGWSHRDLLRLSHPNPPSNGHAAVFRWIVDGAAEPPPSILPTHDDHVGASLTGAMFPDAAVEPLREHVGGGRVVEHQVPGHNGHKLVNPRASRRRVLPPDALPKLITAVEELRRTKDLAIVCSLVRGHRIPHEAVPNEWKKHPELWNAMLDDMGLTALVRNLAKMTSVGLLAPMNDATKRVVKKLTDGEALRAQRVHPMAILLAGGTYKQGHGEKGSLSWTPVPAVLDALDEAFHLAFKAVEPTGKNHLLALDVSGSMSVQIGGTGVSAREAAAAMALVTARVEPWTHTVGFTAGAYGYGGMHGGSPSGLTPIDMGKFARLRDVVAETSRMPMGGTDCSLPMLHAIEKKLEVDVFVVLTDSETWANPSIQPFQALTRYRDKMGRAAKLVVVGMTSTGFSIAPQDDPHCLDVVGLDAATPSLIAEFARGSF